MAALNGGERYQNSSPFLNDPCPCIEQSRIVDTTTT